MLNDFLNPAFLTIVASVSLFLFGVSLLTVPVLINALPSDYFKEIKRPPRERSKAYFLWLILKNFIGLFLLFCGILMLVLPGQGIFTLLIALVFLDFPGKRSLERWFISQKSVLKGVNWIRKKGRKAPFELE